MQALRLILLALASQLFGDIMKIIYPGADGDISIIIPNLSCGLSTAHIAQKDVPHGTPYLIVDDSDLPEDWSMSHCWECDFSSPHGHGMGSQRWFIAQAEAALAEIAARVFTPVEPGPQFDGVSDEEYALHVGIMAQANASAQAAFEAQNQADTDRANALIAQMKAEVLNIEGVEL